MLTGLMSPLAQASEPIPAWRVCFWVAVVVSALAAIYLLRVAFGRSPRSARRLGVLVVLVSVCWVVFYAASSHRWAVNGLSNQAISWVDTDGQASVKKWSLGHEGPCGLHEVRQKTTVSDYTRPATSRDGRGLVEGATLEYGESLAQRLTDMGWDTHRFEGPTVSEELGLLRIHATKNNGYLMFTVENFTVRILAFEHPCMVQHFSFGAPQNATSVDSFVTD